MTSSRKGRRIWKRSEGWMRLKRVVKVDKVKVGDKGVGTGFG